MEYIIILFTLEKPVQLASACTLRWEYECAETITGFNIYHNSVRER